MDGIDSLTAPDLRLAPARWRWAMLGFGAVAACGAVAAIVFPDAAGWTGFVLVAGLGAVGSLLLFSVWPRSKAVASQDVRRVAEAAIRANIAWVVTSPDGDVTDCNDAYRRIAGGKPGEAVNPPELALGSDDSAAVLYRLARHAAVGRAHEECVPLMEGEVTASVRPLSGGYAAWWFTPVPHSAKQRPGAPPPDASSAHGAVLEDAPIGIAIANPDGMLVEANRAFCGFFGAGTKLAGRALSDLIEPAHRESLAERIAKPESAASPIELCPLGQTERMGELYVRPAGNGDGKRALLYLVDVSEQKSLETKFAQSQKMQAVGQLAGGVAHDFNNLLTVIIGNSEFLLMRHQAGDPSFREINDIHQNAIRAANLVRQLLAFSRQQTMQPRVLDLGVVIGELAEMLRRLLREGIELKLERSPDLWPVHADEAQLSNAIINLVVNARDAMPRGGTVTITTRNDTLPNADAAGAATGAAGDYVRVDVRDSGVGIPQEYLGKIFDPFFTTKAIGHGTGLGLATVYGIVKQTGGLITVDSDVGKGTRFSIYLPRHHGEVEARNEAPAIRDITGQETILLVEDEEAVRSFAARALKQRGYNVLEASGGEQALEIVKSRASDIQLLITDVVMPNMDGPTLVRAVKRLKPDMHIIFMSGYAEEAFRRNDEKAADLHFLPKPFGLKQLAAKVKDVLSGMPAR